MGQFYNNDSIAEDVNSFTLESSILPLLPTQLDAKLCNYYQKENTLIIETIEEYLLRVYKEIRMPGVPVTMLIPKDNYTLLASYSLETLANDMANFETKYYAFIEGIDDQNFVLLNSGDKTFHYQQQTPVRTWEIEHNLNKFPSVTISDFDGNEYQATIRYFDKNILQIYFKQPFAGIADLN